MPNSRHLPEDVMFEIFLRLPFKSVGKFRCVSKSWLSRLSNPSFINLLVNRFVTRSCGGSTLWILVSRYEFDGDTHKSPLFSASSTQLHHEIISSQGDSFKLLLGSNTTVPLASSNGILLCSTDRNYPRDYFICNPLTKQFVELPLPRPDADRHPGIPGFDFESSAGTYKVIHIFYCSCYNSAQKRYCSCYYGYDSFSLQTFSSVTCEWTTREVACSQGVSVSVNTIHNIVKHGRMWYWIDGKGEKMVVYNDFTGKYKIKGLPEGKSRSRNVIQEQCLGESNGILYYGKITREADVSSISVWEFLDGYRYKAHVDTWDVRIPTWELVCRRNTEIQDHACGLPWPSRIKFVAFSPVDPNVVIIECHNGAGFLYEAACNIRTRKFEVLRSSHPVVSSDCPRIVVTLQPTIIPTTTR